MPTSLDPQWWEQGLPVKLTAQEIAARDARIEEKREKGNPWRPGWENFSTDEMDEAQGRGQV